MLANRHGVRSAALLFLGAEFLCAGFGNARPSTIVVAQSSGSQSNVPLSSSISKKPIQQVFKQSPNGAVLVKRSTGWSVFLPLSGKPVVISSPESNPRASQASQAPPFEGPPIPPACSRRLSTTRVGSSDLGDLSKYTAAGTVIVKSESTAYVIKAKSDQQLVLLPQASNTPSVEPPPVPVQC